MLQQTSLTVLGRGGMPAPEKLTDAIVSGRLDSRWVEVEGRIHSASTRSGLSILEMVAHHDRVRVVLSAALRWAGSEVADWVDDFECAGSTA